MKMSDLSCAFPSRSPIVCSLARLASIMAKSVDAVYSHSSESMWETYKAAENIHSELRQFAQKVGIGPAHSHCSTQKEEVEAIHLHNGNFMPPFPSLHLLLRGP